MFSSPVSQTKNLSFDSERHIVERYYMWPLQGFTPGMQCKLQTFRAYGALFRNYTNAKRTRDLWLREHRD
jgi:hypothetical protein